MRRVLFAGLLAIALCTSTVMAVPASAFKTHLFKEAFGNANQPSFEGLSTIATDHSTGDIFVAEINSNHQDISRWKSNGEPDSFPALGTNTIDGLLGEGGKPCAEEPASCDATPANGFSGLDIAIDESGGITNGNIYVLDPEHGVEIFSSAGAFLGQLTKFGTKAIGEISGIAVDGVGNLYISDYAKRAVHKFAPTTNPPTNNSFVGDIKAIERPDLVAAGSGPSAGYLFIVQHSGSVPEFSGGVYKVNISTGEVQYPVVDGLIVNNNTDTSIRKVAINPTNGNLFVSTASEVREYDVSGNSSAKVVSTIPGGVGRAGLAVSGASGDLYAAANNAPRVNIFGGTVVTQPDVETGSAVEVTPSKATVHGTVNPDGLALTHCNFEYEDTLLGGGVPVSFTHTTPCEQTTAEIGSGSSTVSVSAHITGLPANRSIYYRLAAENSNDVPVLGQAEQVVTGRVVSTMAATGITATTADINGTVNPDGAPLSECSFEYGTTTAPYQHVAPCAESLVEIGSGEGDVAVHQHIVGLSPGVTYHFRLTATGGDGAAQGSDLSFATTSSVETAPATGLGGSSAILNGTVIPSSEPVTECFFQYVDTIDFRPLAADPYEQGVSIPCAESAAEIGTGSLPVAVHARPSNLMMHTSYRFRLVAGPVGKAVKGVNLEFTTGGPEIDAQWAETVTSGEATLGAQIDTQSTATTYHLEWGIGSAPYEHSTPEAAVGAAVKVNLSSLAPGVTYHYRFVASSYCNASEPAEVCEAAGPDQTFVTYQLLPQKVDCPNHIFRTNGSASLPDCRAFEMVSPLEKNGGNVAAKAETGTYGPLAESAADGDKATFSSLRAFSEPESAPLLNQYLSTRTPTGWSTQSISLPRLSSHRGGGVAQSGRFQAFTEDLCSSWVYADSSLPLVPSAPDGYANLYRRDNCTSESQSQLELLTPTIPTGIEPEGELLGNILGMQGASADLAHTVLRSVGGLTPDSCAAPPAEALQIYETYNGGTQLRLVSVLPNGEAACLNSSVGSPYSCACSALGSIDRHAVSPTGETVYWTTNVPAGKSDLYVRVNSAEPQSDIVSGVCTEAAKGCTLPISLGDHAEYLEATPDGEQALYMVGSLKGGAELRKYDLATHTSQSIASGAEGFVGSSEDLARIYFLSHDVLSGTQTNNEGLEAKEGKPNLYLYENGVTTYIATLAQNDGASPLVFGQSSPAGSPERKNSRVSNDGLHLAFASSATLTAYDNVNTASGEPATEVYLYDAVPGKAGSLHCVSCNPSGARPRAREVKSISGKGSWYLAADLPPWAESRRPSRLLEDGGRRLFFETVDPLTLGDTNGKKDVYEWERADDATACEEVGAELYVASAGGCISLVSSGHSPEDSELVDASEGGKDVFFTTEASLIPMDRGLIDLYDAREGGGFAESFSGPGCEGEACQGPYSPPNDPTPGSSSFEGAGNVREPTKSRCLKRAANRKGRCISSHKKRHAERAGHKRRTGR